MTILYIIGGIACVVLGTWIREKIYEVNRRKPPRKERRGNRWKKS